MSYIDWEPEHESAKERCRLAATLYEAGSTVHEIAVRMRVHPATVYRYLLPGRRILEAEEAARAALYAEELSNR